MTAISARQTGPVVTSERRAAKAAQTSKVAQRGILHYLGLGASAGLLGLMLLIAAAVVVVPAVTNSTTYTVLTSSMEPKLPPGTLIVDRPVTAEEIQVGDVITYQLESGKPVVVTHRVTAITTTDTGAKLFTLMGDNNALPDANLVLPEQLRGKLWYSVPLIGWVNNVVTGAARGWLVPLLAFGLFLYAGYMASSSLVGFLKKRRLARAADGRSDLP